MDVSFNYLAVLVAAVSSMIIGGVWYSKGVLGAKWMQDVGLSEEDTKKGAAKAMSVMFLLSIVTALVMSAMLDYMSAITLADGLLTGVVLWGGFVFTSVTGNALFEQRTGPALWIFLGNQFVTFLVMGAILGAWQ